MSRVSVALFLFLIADTARAEDAGGSKAEAVIAKAKKLTAVDKNGCLRPEDESVIIVCGEGEDNQSQRIFKDGPVDEDRIRRGEASTTKAAQCIGDYPRCPHRLQKVYSVGFGKVPPPAIPLEEVYRGLPEPDMVVQAGSGNAPP
jgi:hypothetical protein